MILSRYRVWRTYYDRVTVCKNTKIDFRQLWARDAGQDDQQKEANRTNPLDLIELHKLSGSNYDFMVARAVNMACGFMQPGETTAGVSSKQLHQLPDHSEICKCKHCEEQTLESMDVKVITPFDLALVSLYVHSVDKKALKSVNAFDLTFYEAKQRFIAALDVVETMLRLDDERARRQMKSNTKTHSTIDDTTVSNPLSMSCGLFGACKQLCSSNNDGTANISDGDQQKLLVIEAKSMCRSAKNVHFKFSSNSIILGFLMTSLYCALVTFCSLWMATSPSSELAQWQSSISSAVYGDNTQLGVSYEDFNAFHSALAKFSVPWPPDSSFTRSLGSPQLRVIRFKTQPSSSCVGSDNLSCVPTINLSPSMSLDAAMLPPAAYSDTPATFSVPPFSNSFKYKDSKTPIRCGIVYCFDGSGYTFQAADSSEFLAAVTSPIFDSSVRAVIISFALYSPSLQAAYQGSYLAEMLPTGSVLGSFDAFVFSFADAVPLDRTVLSWSKLLWAVKIFVSACVLDVRGALMLIDAGLGIHIFLLHNGVHGIFARGQL